jgi:anthranilate phosphoribosyltransferase
MKFAIGARREIGIRTIFNILGPLTNPAGARRQVLGVFASRLTETLASVLGNLGALDCMVVHGEDGLDEITACDGTRISRYHTGFVDTFYIRPEDFGFKKHDHSHLIGDGKDANARIALSVLNGEEGPRREIVLMNAAAALMVAGTADDFITAVDIAADAIDSKRAIVKLEEIKKITNSL